MMLLLVAVSVVGGMFIEYYFKIVQSTAEGLRKK